MTHQTEVGEHAVPDHPQPDTAAWVVDAEDGTAIPGPPRTVRAPLHQRIGSTTAAAIAELRFVRERPNCLLDHIDYARDGEWTVRDDGQLRHAALLWAYLVAIPISAVAYFVVWAVARPVRCACVVGIAALCTTALNAVPVVELVIPDWADLGDWPPFSWF